jgi:hypothetical protein
LAVANRRSSGSLATLLTHRADAWGMTTAKKPPWRRARPAGKRTTLSAADKKRARARARRAGRRYPNLVDNMRAAQEEKKRKR